HQVHLLRLLRRELPGRLHRRDAHPRISRREARRPLLHQGDAAGNRRSLRERDCRQPGGRRPLSLKRSTGRATFMQATTVLFYIFAAVTVFAALRVISARNPVHSALFLVLTFCSAAAIWMLLQAEFLAITLVLVYV